MCVLFIWKIDFEKGGFHQIAKQGSVAQSVTCLATDASLTADPGV